MKLLTSLLALAVLGGFAFAADEKPAGDKPKRSPEEAFKKLDSNSDNAVDLEEFKAGPMGKKDPVKAEEVFKKRDKDGDGKLTLEEMKPGKKANKQ